MGRIKMPASFNFTGNKGDIIEDWKEITAMARKYFKKQPDKSMEMRLKILSYCVKTHYPNPTSDNSRNLMLDYWMKFLWEKRNMLNNDYFFWTMRGFNEDPSIIADHMIWEDCGFDKLLSKYSNSGFRKLRPILSIDEAIKCDVLSAAQMWDDNDKCIWGRRIATSLVLNY